VGRAADVERLAARKHKVWIRFVLVPGLTDDSGDIGHIARFTAGSGDVERVGCCHVTKWAGSSGNDSKAVPCRS
jgi:pyruvate-formate lyase-activating enzyme